MTTITRNRLNIRLDQLAALRHGWSNGVGMAPTPAALHSARTKAEELGAAKYHIFPTLDGGLSFEPQDAKHTYFAVLSTGGIHAA